MVCAMVLPGFCVVVVVVFVVCGLWLWDVDVVFVFGRFLVCVSGCDVDGVGLCAV